jgi:hypothetical protein
VVGLAFAFEGEVPAEDVARMSDAAAGVPHVDPQTLSDAPLDPIPPAALDPDK